MPTAHDWETRFSERLAYLCGNMPDYSDEWVARELAELHVAKTSQYVQQLRTGKKTNPTLNVVYGLASVFGVPASYFLGDEEEVSRINDQLAVLFSMRKAGVTGLAMRAAELSPEALRWVNEVVDRELRRAEGPSAG